MNVASVSQSSSRIIQGGEWTNPDGRESVGGLDDVDEDDAAAHGVVSDRGQLLLEAPEQ